jgi:hypothetical protein
MVISEANWPRKEILMKSMLTLSLLTAALLFAPRASHAASLTSEAPASCAANSSLAALPFSNPAVPKFMFPRPKCGSCSVSICRGADDFAPCGVLANGRLMFCDDFGSCPVDGLLNCTCTANLS